MTTATDAGVRVRAPRTARVANPAGARLLIIELRRNAMPWMLPLTAALFWFDTYRPSTGQPPIWVLRTFWNMGQGHTIVDFGPFVAGMAAWMGSRDGMRGTTDLVTATARPRWAAQLATWAATCIWAVGAYLAFVAVLFEVYERQGVQGSPPWWWVAVGATAVAMFSAAGFAIGAFFASRFAAPLAAFCGFLAMMLSSQTGFRSSSGWALILPTNSNGNYGADSGIFYPLLPDLPIARVMFLAGIAIAALGLIGLPARAGGPWLRRAAALVMACGIALAGTAVWLATTARLEPNGMVVPALHDAANDRPISYRPACGQATIPSCVNPAYRADLPDVTAAVGPVAREITGLPGVPVRTTQVAIYYTGAQARVGTIAGRPPVLRLPLGALGLVGAFGLDPRDFVDQMKIQFVSAFLGIRPGGGTPAQQAVLAAMLARSGLPFDAQPKALMLNEPQQAAQAVGHYPPSNGPKPAPARLVYAAARRFAALSPAAQHAWLAAHLAALRSGRLTLAQLP